MTRTLSTLVVASLLILTAVTPASAALFGLGGGSSDAPVPEPARFGADGDPSFIVEVEPGSMASLTDWASASEARRLIEQDNASNMAVVAAPSWEVVGAGVRDVAFGDAPVDSLWSDALATRSYVESVSPNLVLSYAEPVETLANESDYETPTVGTFAFDDPAFSQDGMAFDGDANKTTMAESRDIIGVDNVSATGDGVTVAVIDTGLNVAGGTLFGNGTANATVSRVSNASKNFITGESVNATAGNYDAVADGNGHGSWVSGAIAANSTNNTWDGVAPQAEILALKALADDGSGSTANIVDAIRYAADHDADVISMSLGSPVYSKPLADAINNATQQGSVVVVATGNSRATYRPVSVATPADTPNALGVAATNGSAAKTAGAAYFSQVSGSIAADNNATNAEQVDVAAPGMATQARVADESGFVSTHTLSGTSMATPMVAGVAALVEQEHPTWSVEKTQTWLIDGARPIPNAAEAEVGHGMVAADNAISQTAPKQSQADAMDDAAATRDTFLEALADASGGLIPDLL